MQGVTGHEQHWARSDPATVGTDPAGAAALPVTLEQPFTVADLYALRAAVSAHADAAELPPLIVGTAAAPAG